MKKTISFFLVVFAFSIIITANTFCSESDISVSVNGADIKTNVPPRIIDGRTMLPVRDIFEMMGATVIWTESTKEIKGVKGSNTVIMHINDTSFTLNGVEASMDTPPVIIEGRTLAPARYVAESFGAKVSWNEKEKCIEIIYDELLEATTETTTEETTEITTETTIVTTRNETKESTQTSSVATEYTPELIKRVQADIKKAIDSYSLGSADSAQRLKVAYYDRHIKPEWTKLAVTKDDKSYLNQCLNAYRRYISYAMSIDWYYHTNTYKKYKETPNECRECKKAVTDCLTNIQKTTDLTIIKDNYNTMKTEYDEFKETMRKYRYDVY